MGSPGIGSGSPVRLALRAAVILAALTLLAGLAAGAAGCDGDEGGSGDDVSSPATTGEGDPPGAAGGERDQLPGRSTTKESGSPSGREAESGAAPSPEEAARLFLVSRDAERVCKAVLDPGFLRATYGDPSGCVAARRPATLTRDPGLGKARESGGRARLEASPEGGLYDGQRLTFTFGEDEDGWRVERITSNVQVGP